MRAKKYLWSILCVYFCYLTHGIQAIILSQNNVNFAKQWGFNMTCLLYTSQWDRDLWFTGFRNER